MKELDLGRGQRDLLQLLYQNQQTQGNPLTQLVSAFAPTPYAPPGATPEQQPKPQAAKPMLQGSQPQASRIHLGQKLEPLNAGKDFVEGMVRRGWKPNEAAGAAGNVHVESGFQPYIQSSVPGEHSYGLLQWNGDRLHGLQNYAQATGKDWTDPDTQMDWINMERTGDSVKYGGTDERGFYKRAFAGGGSPAEIAQRFGFYVERPLDLSQSVDLRRRAAEHYAGVGQSAESSIGQSSES